MPRRPRTQPTAAASAARGLAVLAREAVHEIACGSPAPAEEERSTRAASEGLARSLAPTPHMARTPANARPATRVPLAKFLPPAPARSNVPPAREVRCSFRFPREQSAQILEAAVQPRLHCGDRRG